MAAISMREAFGKALLQYGEENQDIVVLDADTSSSTLTKIFAQRFPERFYNIGIAEPCMVDVAVGLALGGLIPFANAFSALLSLRAIEAIRSNICYARTNVKLVAHYAGLSDYKDGPTHHSISDIAIFRSLPGMTLIVPSDATQTAAFVPLMAEKDGPITMRISRGASIAVHKEGEALEIGKAIARRKGKDVGLIACGSMVGRCMAASEILAREGIDAAVLEIHTIKPIDRDSICRVAAEAGAIVTAEEHSILGGLGGAVAEVLAEECPTPMARIGISDTFARTAPDTDSLMDTYGLSIDQIVSAAIGVLKKKEKR
jgi:transketolase